MKFTETEKKIIKGLKCNCCICKVTRKYMKIISKLPKKDKKWMEDFYDGTIDTAESLAWYRYKRGYK